MSVYLFIFIFRFDCNDEEVQSEGDDNESEDEGVYQKRQHFSKYLLIIAQCIVQI